MTTPGTPAALPVLDADTFGRRYASAPGFEEVVWATFRTYAPQLVSELARAIGEKDDAEVFRLSHSLRGNAGMIAAPALEQLARQLEDAAAAAVAADYEPLFALIEVAMAQVLDMAPSKPAGPQ